MSIKREFYGTMPNGREVTAFVIENQKLRARVLDYGAALDALWVPDREGRALNILQTFESLEERLARSSYQGETVGRFANRIAGARFCLNGREHRVTANQGGNICLHGAAAFSHALWEAEAAGENTVELRLTSPAGDQGFPGRVEALLRYVLTEDALEIQYSAVSDEDTILNLTNHAYYNLKGEGLILDHLLRIDAAAFLPTDENSIPTGELRAVEGTAFDFRAAKPIGRDIGAPDEQLIRCRGYDHNYCLSGNGPAAVVAEPASGRRMTLYTDQPGVQLYTGNFLDDPGKDGIRYSGFCLETQAWPDSPNRPEFPSCVLRGGEEYRTFTKMVFDLVSQS
ncbi:MAG: galactose mutarotase [Oscillospiraceae bacterium]|nr:galactose mutarotase [Oscillospiraceae bacterium]